MNSVLRDPEFTQSRNEARKQLLYREQDRLPGFRAIGGLIGKKMPGWYNPDWKKSCNSAAESK